MRLAKNLVDWLAAQAETVAEEKFVFRPGAEKHRHGAAGRSFRSVPYPVPRLTPASDMIGHRFKAEEFWPRRT